ncbi:MAG: hypothetical protein H7A50_06715 [Akkermansiaceae bacterium]|nr:hypothetical protein [Akkermansiaceae bacterium]
MWLATTISDGIAVVIFATMLFLLLYGIVVVVKAVSRWVFRMPNPSRVDSLELYVEHNDYADDGDEDGDLLQRFLLHANETLVESKAGHLSGVEELANEELLAFEGRDVDEIWIVLEDVVNRGCPKRPLRVVLHTGGRKGDTRTIESIAWQPDPEYRLEWTPPAEKSETWDRVGDWGRMLSFLGIAGLLGWNVIRRLHGKSENGFRETIPGAVFAWLVGSVLVIGLSITLIVSIRSRVILKRRGFPSGDTPTENTLKHVLLLVILIFAAVLFLSI